MTIVQFIGLFILIYTPDVGYQILMPHFNIQPQHDSVIAYRVGDRIMGTDKDEWKVAGTYTVEGVNWEYVNVQKQFITIAGSTDEIPVKLDPGPNKPGPPHLSCCCSALKPPSAGGKGIQNAYKDPDLPETAKKGAQVIVNRGIASSVVWPPEAPDGRIDSQFAMNTMPGTGVVIQGTVGGNVSFMRFNPGARINFGNTPLCVLKLDCPPDIADENDFPAYYTVAVDPNTCNGSPGNCSQCRSNPTECPPSGACSNTRNTKKKTAAKTTHAAPPTGNPHLMGTIDCSNSQWP